MSKRNLTTSIVFATVVAFAACDSEEMAPEGGHTPDDAALFVVGGAELTPDVTLGAGQTVQVEVRFLDHQGNVIGDIESSHYAALTFSPGTLATTVAVTGRTFAFDLTAQAGAATGTLVIGYGHDEEADELSFGPFNVTVE